MVMNLVKCHPVGELVAKLKSGKFIAKEQVVRESESLRIKDPIPSPLILVFSGEQGGRRGNSDNVVYPVTQMSPLDFEDRRALPLFNLYPQSVLRRDIIPPAPGAGPNLDMSSVQQICCL